MPVSLYEPDTQRPLERPKVGPFALTRPLDPCGLAERWLALHEEDQSSHVAYRLPACRGRSDFRRVAAAIESVSSLVHPHLLGIEHSSFDDQNRAWLITPFTGDADGVRTLARLLREKGGQMHPAEAERALTQVLEAVEHAHGAASAIHHGVLSMDEVLVDRHGRVVLELYGLGRALRGVGRGNGEAVRDEVRSIVEIGYQLVTGLRAEEPLIPAGRLVKRLDPRWDRWLETGLDATGGFATAAEALEALPSRTQGSEPVRAPAGVAGVLWRLRTVRR